MIRLFVLPCAISYFVIVGETFQVECSHSDFPNGITFVNFLGINNTQNMNA